MTTEKLSTEIRKEQIAEAVLQVLGDNNIKRFNMADIAGQVGLVPSALYRHFKGRDALMSAVLELIRSKLYGNIEAVRQQTDGAVDRLRDLLFRHGQLICQNHGIPRIIFSDELWGQKRERRQRVYRIVTGYLAEIEDIIREGQDQGSIRRDIQARVMAAMFFGIVQPAALLWHMSDGVYDVEGHVTAAWPIFLETITR
ncbi:MAG: hypothetical protein A2521_16045 [Deltaproteobacteria bacterium RIFOXYD12_FULL_57_12]|nr:MAG: hypothetical protein A2521_16045 [Deltaproteobacteria bacterium RIFOXYD12_FULL_57_12]